MINTEQAFDMLPHVIEIYEKLDLDNYRKSLMEKHKGQKEIDTNEVGLSVILYIVKNSTKVKEEFFTIVAIADNKTVEEIKSQSLILTAKTFKEIFSDPELMDFFKTAMQ